MSLGQGEGEEGNSVWKRRALGWLQLCKLPEAASQAGKPATLTLSFLLEERRGHSGFSGVWLGSRGGAHWPPAQPSGGPGGEHRALAQAPSGDPRPPPHQQLLLSPGEVAGRWHVVGTVRLRLGPSQGLHPASLGPLRP